MLFAGISLSCDGGGGRAEKKKMKKAQMGSCKGTCGWVGEWGSGYLVHVVAHVVIHVMYHYTRGWVGFLSPRRSFFLSCKK